MEFWEGTRNIQFTPLMACEPSPALTHHDLCLVPSSIARSVFFGDGLTRAALVKDSGECLDRNEKVLLPIDVGLVFFMLFP